MDPNTANDQRGGPRGPGDARGVWVMPLLGYAVAQGGALLLWAVALPGAGGHAPQAGIRQTLIVALLLLTAPAGFLVGVFDGLARATRDPPRLLLASVLLVGALGFYAGLMWLLLVAFDAVFSCSLTIPGAGCTPIATNTHVAGLAVIEGALALALGVALLVKRANRELPQCEQDRR